MQNQAMHNKMIATRFLNISIKCAPLHNFKMLKSFALLLSLTCINPAFALPEDSNKPIDVAANNASLDDKKGTTILTGAVKIVQGTMTITANQLIIYRDKKGDINKMIATGKLAHFSQQQQKDKPYSKAWGSKMVYSVAKQTVTITGSARVEQQSDKFTGQTIVYHMDKAIVKASGGKQRVKMVIQPKGKK